MQKMSKYLLAGAGILGVMTLAITSQSALAFRGNGTGINTAGTNGSLANSERHTQMEQAFANNDYTAWKNLMNGRGRVTEVVSQNNFSRFAEMHKLTEEGKTAEAQKIRTELGLGNGSGKGQESGRGMRGNCPYNQNK